MICLNICVVPHKFVPCFSSGNVCEEYFAYKWEIIKSHRRRNMHGMFKGLLGKQNER
jgi:hypothetical protein